jgi:hypothetical protein
LDSTTCSRFTYSCDNGGNSNTTCDLVGVLCSCFTPRATGTSSCPAGTGTLWGSAHGHDWNCLLSKGATSTCSTYFKRTCLDTYGVGWIDDSNGGCYKDTAKSCPSY